MTSNEPAGGRACESDCDGDGCPSRLSATGRRRVLGALAGGTTLSLAGCIGVFGEPAQSEAPDRTIGESADDEDDDESDDDEEGSEEGPVHEITFLRQDATIEIPEGGDSLLYQGLDQGWDLPYSCERGVCGVCTARISGNGHRQVEMTNNEVLDDDEIERGYVLTCTGHPTEEFFIRTDDSP
ncbi:2Fe-2S iron-sulfur cluster-binding protein [Halorubrum sp. DTA98]|uniref:2Fe-2S iron-sulfur cluster-binding protein n=1 Tax=Halorubrum sp. DTA98 TaxID=3402163 RepID=UPI003AACF8F6